MWDVNKYHDFFNNNRMISNYLRLQQYNCLLACARTKMSSKLSSSILDQFSDIFRQCSAILRIFMYLMVFIYFDCNFRYLYGVLGNIKHRPPCNITCEKSYIAGSEKTLDRADSPSRDCQTSESTHYFLSHEYF